MPITFACDTAPSVADVRPDDLARRLDRAERANRRLAVACVLGPILAVGVSLGLNQRGAQATPAAQAPAKRSGVIEARGLVIRGKDGKVAATLGFDDDAEKIVGLKLYHKGVVRSEHRLALGSPSTSYSYPNGNDALVLIATETDPSIVLSDAQGDQRMDLHLFEGRPGLVLSHAKLKDRFQLGIYGSGIPSMDFFDQDDKVLPMLGKDGRPLVRP